MFLIDLQMYTSSANRPIVDETVDGMSLIKLRNINGPGTVPCGTTDVKADTDDVTLASSIL